MTMSARQYIRSVLSDPLQVADKTRKECNLCHYRGRFWSFGSPPRRHSRCPGCTALERHRLYGLLLARNPDMIRGKTILHFAPEAPLTTLFTSYKPLEYITADMESGMADHREDMTALTFKDAQFDLAIANHVLEHIPDDAKAFAEIHRVLKPGGIFLVTIPIDKTRTTTYENTTITTPKDRIKHFGQYDHVRVYGRDFMSRFEKAGFEVSRYQAEPQDYARHGLTYEEVIFLGRTQ